MRPPYLESVRHSHGTEGIVLVNLCPLYFVATKRVLEVGFGVWNEEDVPRFSGSEKSYQQGAPIEQLF